MVMAENTGVLRPHPLPTTFAAWLTVHRQLLEVLTQTIFRDVIGSALILVRGAAEQGVAHISEGKALVSYPPKSAVPLSVKILWLVALKTTLRLATSGADAMLRPVDNLPRRSIPLARGLTMKKSPEETTYNPLLPQIGEVFWP